MTQVYAFKVYTRFQVCTQEKLRMFFQLPLCTWISLHIFEQRVGFEQQVSIKAKLNETVHVYMLKINLYSSAPVDFLKGSIMAG